MRQQCQKGGGQFEEIVFKVESIRKRTTIEKIRGSHKWTILTAAYAIYM